MFAFATSKLTILSPVHDSAAVGVYGLIEMLFIVHVTPAYAWIRSTLPVLFAHKTLTVPAVVKPIAVNVVDLPW